MNPSCGTVALYGLFMNCFFLADHMAMDFTLSVAPLNSKFSQQNALWERSHVDNSFRYIFIYHFSYLLTYYYSFLAHYNKKCFDINWFHLLSPAISCLCGILALRSHDFWEMTLTTKYVFGLFTFYRRFCTAIFLSEIKYLFNLEGNILHISTRNVIFFYDYSNWGELSFNIFKFFI